MYLYCLHLSVPRTLDVLFPTCFSNAEPHRQDTAYSRSVGYTLYRWCSKRARRDEVASVPFVGIFGADGKFQRQLVFEDDVTKQNVKQKKPFKTNLSEANQIRDFLQVTLSSDGR